MKDSFSPPRMIDSDAEDAALRDVLRAVKGDPVSTSDIARAMEAFEGSKLAATARAGKAAKAASGWSWTAPVAFGASLAVVCALAVTVRMQRSSTATPELAHASASVMEPAAAPSPAVADDAPVARVEDLPSAPPAEIPASKPRAAAAVLPSTKPSAIASSRSAPDTASSFQEELAIIETARGALARGDGESCLRALDRYEQRFSSGLFTDEVAVMRIEALVARGDRARAKALGAKFLERSPDSTYASRIRSILSTAP